MIFNSKAVYFMLHKRKLYCLLENIYFHTNTGYSILLKAPMALNFNLD